MKKKKRTKTFEKSFSAEQKELLEKTIKMYESNSEEDNAMNYTPSGCASNQQALTKE